MKLASLFNKTVPAIAIAVAALCAGAWRAEAGAYLQTNLVSDTPGLAAITDPELVNPWGVSHSPTSPFWTSNQGKNTATLYTVTGGINVTKVNINPPSGFVAIPTTASGPQGPTGQVNNGNTASFLVGNGGDGKSAHFIFANLNGTIAAWDTGTKAIIQATTAGALYTGLAVNAAQTRLYAANDAGTGSINVFDSSFAPVSLSPTAFANPFPKLVPFNVQDIGGKVYATYAPAGRPNQTTAPLGAGGVAVFDENGTLLQTLITGSQLAAPWGVALAPSDFGPFSNDLLVGNFSYLHSEINAFDPTSGALLGTIPIDVGAGNTAGGLWDLIFGNGGNGGSPDVLYFSDGINGETDGLFAALSIPEPSGLAMLAAALALLAVRRMGFGRQG
jgi:uncharacterized protein (TIGR03118 family)